MVRTYYVYIYMCSVSENKCVCDVVQNMCFLTARYIYENVCLLVNLYVNAMIAFVAALSFCVDLFSQLCSVTCYMLPYYCSGT